MMAVAKAEQGGTSGGPEAWLRLEGAGLLLVCGILFAQTGASGWLFAALFLVPDLSFLAYRLGRQAGTTAYNVSHSEVGPVILGLAGLWLMPALVPVALIWGAHIGWDRMLGYGLKYPTGFDHTHLGLIGKTAKAARRIGHQT